MPTPNPHRLLILTDLRRAAGLGLRDFARRCGLTGRQSHQTAGRWEQGVYAPAESRRVRMIGYLWDDLGLRRDPERFEEVWQILVDEWRWAVISDAEWRAFTTVARPRWGEVEKAEVEDGRAPGAAGEAAPHQWPAVTPHFVGREDELARIERLLLDGRRPVALVGMGGVGKTTLAACSARRLSRHFPDGVLWAGVAVSAPLDILDSWARAYGHDYSGLADVESRAAAVRSLLAPKRVLIVLDDVDAPGPVKALLPGGEHAAVLLTTRSEDVAVSLQSQVLRPAALDEAASLALLSSLIGAGRLAAQREAGAALCALLHNLPLAVEIAGQLLAARSRRPVAQLAERLQAAQNRLNLGIADRDVRASFGVSWEALDAAHQAAFSHMALFAGRSFTAAALAAVLELDALELDEADVLEQVDTLAARSLVTPVADARYRQHPLLADFGQEMLVAPAAAWQRFAAAHLAFARAHQHDYPALTAEWDNLLAGMATAHRLAQWAMVLDYAATLADGWFAGARYADAQRGFAWAIEAADAVGNPAAAAFGYVNYGHVRYEMGATVDAARALADGLALAEAHTLPRLIAEAHYYLACLALDQADYDQVQARLAICTEIYEELEEHGGYLLTQQLQAFCSFRLGNGQEARARCIAALARPQVDDHLLAAVRLWRLLIDIAIDRKEYAEAQELAVRGREIAQQLQYKDELLEIDYSIAIICRMTDDYEQAAARIQEVIAGVEQMGNQSFLAYALHEAAVIGERQQAYADARHAAQRSLALVTQQANRYMEVICLQTLGRIYAATGDSRQARETLQAALTLATELDHTSYGRVLADIQALAE